MVYKLIVIISFHFCGCDWVEIPQTSISSNIEKTPRKSVLDIVLFNPLTTSTTWQTPTLMKPATSKVKSSRRKSSSGSRTSENGRRNKNGGSNHKKQSPPEEDNIVPIKNKVRIISNVSNLKVHHPERTSSAFPIPDDWDEGHIEDDNIEELDYGFQNDRNFNTSEYDINNEEQTGQEEEEEGYSYSSFVPYLSKVQSALMRNAHSNRKSKVSILTNLRDHLLYQIQSRISSIWKPKSEVESRDSSHESGVDFPSNEAALMTIGFLTFAVFLIKLVLKLVQAIQAKVNNGTTTNAALLGRRRRDAFDSDSIKILSYIDDYSFNNNL